MASQKKTAAKSTKPQTTDELKAELVKVQTELVEARRSHAARELANTNRLGELRRTVARMKTALNAQQSEEKK